MNLCHETMTHISVAILGLLLTLVAIQSIDIASPDGAPCWESLQVLVFTEVRFIIQGIDLSVERKYMLCNDTEYLVGTISSSAIVTGGDWPMVVATPNLHIFCQRNCTLSSQGPSVLFPTIELLNNATTLIPPSYNPRADNLIIDGLTFTSRGNASSVFDILLPAQNIVVKNCVWKGSGQVDGMVEVGSALRVLYNGQADVVDGPFVSITVQDSVIEANIFTVCLMYVQVIEDGMPPPSGESVFDFSVDRCIFRNNSLLPEMNDMVGLLHFIDGTKVSVTDSCFVNNDAKGSVHNHVIYVNSTEYTFSNNHGSANVLSTNGACVGDIFLEKTQQCQDFDAVECTPTATSSAIKFGTNRLASLVAFVLATVLA